jgi:hypothetical protein
MTADELDRVMREEAVRYHRQARRMGGDLDDVGVRTGRQRRRRRAAAVASAGAVTVVLVALLGSRPGDVAVRYGGPDGTDAPAPTSPVAPITVASTPSTAAGPAVPAPATTPTSSAVPSPTTTTPVGSAGPAVVATTTTVPTSSTVPARTAAGAGRSFPLAGTGCLWEGRPGAVVVDLRGAGPGSVRLPLDATNERYEAVADSDGRWAVTPVVPAEVLDGGYPAVPVCIETPGTRRTDLSDAVTFVVVGGTPSTVSTQVPPRVGR